MITLKSGKVKPYKEKKTIRVIADPFVVAPPTATTIKTRIHPDQTSRELEDTVDTGMYLGSEQREDLARLIKAQSSGFGPLRAKRKQELTATTSSRWAGSITRNSNDQFELGIRNLQAHIESLEAKIAAITKKMELPLQCDVAREQAQATKKKGKTANDNTWSKNKRWSKSKNKTNDENTSTVTDKQAPDSNLPTKSSPTPTNDVTSKPPSKTPEATTSKPTPATKPKGPKGYKNKKEKAGAKRRLGNLQAKLDKERAKLNANRPSITIGGKKLFKKRNNLDAAKLTQEQWGQKWGAKRMFLTADGDAVCHFGNGCIWVDHDGFLHIKVPEGLVETLGKTEIVFTTPVTFAYKGNELQDRIINGGAIRGLIG